ncbi:MAG TPA: lysophospholipid acyltransferase family protein [Candidatus Aquilonibacter sp.]|nr:lysophospholipid acyltransferase family protein [Candidatus Aquilonibacter sp.]
MNFVYPLTMFWIRVGGAVFFRVRAYGRANIPRRGAYLFAGNHQSNLDPPIYAGFASPRTIRFMAKEELFSKPILSWLLPQLQAFAVNREGSVRAPLMESLKFLRAGECVWVLPEGRRRDAHEEQEARQGLAWLAITAQVPVVPCAVAGSGGARFFRTEIKVAYGSPIAPPAGKATKEALAKFTNEIMRAIEALYEDIGGNSQG